MKIGVHGWNGHEMKGFDSRIQRYVELLANEGKLTFAESDLKVQPDPDC